MAETEVEHGEDGLPESRREAVVGCGQMAWGVPFIGPASGPIGRLEVAASARPCADNASAHAWVQVCSEVDSGREFAWR
jgi:hypothetical protein